MQDWPGTSCDAWYFCYRDMLTSFLKINTVKTNLEDKNTSLFQNL